MDIDYSNVGDSITGGHGGGDAGIVNDLYKYVMEDYDSEDLSKTDISAKNHMIVFAAEESRLNNTVVDVDKYINKYI